MKILLNETYLHEELLAKGYEILDMEISDVSERYEANLFKDGELIGRIRDVGNSSWTVFATGETGLMVPGKLYEGSAEKTVILQCIASVGDFIEEDLLKKDPTIISKLVNDLWNNDEIWADFDSRIAEKVEKFKEDNPRF